MPEKFQLPATRERSIGFMKNMLENLSDWFQHDPLAPKTNKAIAAVKDQLKKTTMDTAGRSGTAAGNQRDGD